MEGKGLKEPDVTVLRGSGLRADLERGIQPTKGRFLRSSISVQLYSAPLSFLCFKIRLCLVYNNDLNC